MSVMTVYDTCFYGDDEHGYAREYQYDADVESLGCGAGRFQCPACEAEEPTPDDERNNDDLWCIECKDTGYVLVSI